MDILKKARRLEHAIVKTLDGVSQRLTQSAPRDPLAVMLAIVDAVEHEIQQAGRGTRVLPFNRIRATVTAGTRTDRARFDAVFEGDPSLEERIVERLRRADCEVPPGLSVKVAYLAAAPPGWVDPRFQLEFARTLPAGDLASNAEPLPRIELTVVYGAAEQKTYAFSLARIDIGRCVDVRDKQNHLLRKNHVAFRDASGSPNRTVSRRHAHIACQATLGTYRVFDERSAYGTSVVRDGRTIGVPPGSRGIRLKSGDEIVLGEARLAVRLSAP